MIDKIIQEALEYDYIVSKAIEDFTKEELTELAEKAKKQGCLVTLTAEHSNAYQGVMVSVVNKTAAKELLKYL